MRAIEWLMRRLNFGEQECWYEKSKAMRAIEWLMRRLNFGEQECSIFIDKISDNKPVNKSKSNQIRNKSNKKLNLTPNEI